MIKRVTNVRLPNFDVMWHTKRRARGPPSESDTVKSKVTKLISLFSERITGKSMQPLYRNVQLKDFQCEKIRDAKNGWKNRTSASRRQ